jgi:hypothetical protein
MFIFSRIRHIITKDLYTRRRKDWQQKMFRYSVVGCFPPSISGKVGSTAPDEKGWTAISEKAADDDQ